MGLVDDDECRFCMEEPETAEHLICECVAFHYHRNLILESGTINLENFTETSMDKLMQFLSCTKLIEKFKVYDQTRISS